MLGPRSNDSQTVISGGTIPGSGEPAFRLIAPSPSALPVLIAVPHAGRAYPPALLRAMRNPGVATLRLEDRMVDVLADGIAQQVRANVLLADAPRAMLDLNRAPDDMDWSMVTEGRPPGARHSAANRRARTGLGLIPRRVSGLGDVWRMRLPRVEVEQRIALVHEPYHRALSRALHDLRKRWGVALLIDLHSMPPLRPRHPGEKPAEFVIGDRFGASCDDSISARALSVLGETGRSVAHNRPYAGGYVLDRHGKPTLGLHAIQLEVCRSLYLDARMEEASARLPALVRTLSTLVRELAQEILPPAREAGLPLAAE